MALLARPAALATATGVAVLLACPLAVAARERDIPDAGAVLTGAAADHAHLKDTVLRREAPVMRAARARAGASVYTSADGYRVEVEVSPAYPPDPAGDQALVDFLGSRLHGPEFGGLAVYVGTPREIQQLCGGGAGVVACYSIGEGRMYVPGESVGGIPVEYPLTHEYGHHVASWRSNNPWDALDWGAKHWASATRVCAHVRRGRLFPGNQGAHYRDDPGEGFADGYAHLHYPQTPWYFNELMRPGPAQFAAIRRDVLHPWSRPRSRTFRGSAGPRRAVRRFRIRVRLDGELRVRLTGPRRATYEVQAETPGFAAGGRLRAGAGFGVEWCRRRPAELVKLTVRRRRGPAGRFALRVSWPG
ncbi:MAG: hypothetical protein ACRDLD_12440 [Thermoleophilaceae bacterium]